MLFADGPLWLRVFEPRYVDMVARCLRGVNRFGVVAIRQGGEVGDATWYDLGTAAEIVDWHQESGGLLGVLGVGRETFRVQQSHRQTDGLYVGEVAWLPPLPKLALPLEHAELAGVLRNLLEPLPAYRGIATSYDDAVWVGCRLAEILPLALPLKQSLLETQDALVRLARLAAVFRSGEAGA